MKNQSNLIIQEKIEKKIFIIRGKKIMLDHDLADLYSVKTHRLNEQVKRNLKRFPADFIFQLSDQEKSEVIANCDNLKMLKFSPVNPYAFTEQGIAMLSSVLNSDRAIEVNIQIMRTFAKIRKLMITHKDLRIKIEDVERKYGLEKIPVPKMAATLYSSCRSFTNDHCKPEHVTFLNFLIFLTPQLQRFVRWRTHQVHTPRG